MKFTRGGGPCGVGIYCHILRKYSKVHAAAIQKKTSTYYDDKRYRDSGPWWSCAARVAGSWKITVIEENLHVTVCLPIVINISAPFHFQMLK